MNVIDFARERGGLITAKDAVEAGLQYSRLSEAAARGEIVRVSHGVYCLPEAWEDEYLIAQLRFPRGVFSDGTALFLHDFTDRTPERLTMTFPRSYNATGPRESGIVVRTCATEVFDLGLTKLRTLSGNEVRAYDLERTLCDLLRGRATPDVQVVNAAMKRYAREKRAGVGKLLDYADALGVLSKVRSYMEVLL